MHGQRHTWAILSKFVAWEFQTCLRNNWNRWSSDFASKKFIPRFSFAIIRATNCSKQNNRPILNKFGRWNGIPISRVVDYVDRAISPPEMTPLFRLPKGSQKCNVQIILMVRFWTILSIWGLGIASASKGQFVLSIERFRQQKKNDPLFCHIKDHRNV